MEKGPENEKLRELIKPIHQLDKLAQEVEALCDGYNYPCGDCDWGFNSNTNPDEDTDILF